MMLRCRITTQPASTLTTRKAAGHPLASRAWTLGALHDDARGARQSVMPTMLAVAPTRGHGSWVGGSGEGQQIAAHPPGTAHSSEGKLDGLLFPTQLDHAHKHHSPPRHRDLEAHDLEEGGDADTGCILQRKTPCHDVVKGRLRMDPGALACALKSNVHP